VSDANSQNSTQPELPRLRIHHFFVLTTTFAVVMSVWLGIWRLIRSVYPDAVAPGFGAEMPLVFGVYTLLPSVCIGIALLGLAWRKRGISFPSQPGHWMAIYLAVTWAYEIVAWLFSFFMRQAFGVESMAWVTMPMSLAFHCFAFALWVAAYLHEPARIWKLGWAALALKSLLTILLMLFYIGAKCIEWLLETYWYNSHFDWQLFLSLGSYASFFMLLPNYALLTFLPAAATLDLRQHRQRHWSHWLVLISTFVSTAVLTVYYYYAF